MKENFTLDRYSPKRPFIEKAGLPADLRYVRLYRMDKEQQPAEVRGQLADWLDHYGSGERPLGQGLLLYGPPGRGKTTLAAAVLQQALVSSLTTRMEHRPEVGKPVTTPILFLPYAKLLELKQQSIRADRTGSWTDELLAQQHLLDAAMGLHPIPSANVRLLVLDDIGKEHTTSSGWAEDTFDLLLRTREAAGWPTICTTNVHPGLWPKVYGEAMGSFLHQAFRLVTLTAGADRRAA